MKLSQKEVEHIAQLARLELTVDEKKKFTKQLVAILDYVGQLQKVGADAVKPTSQVTGLLDVMRDDQIKGCSEEIQKKIMDNVPNKEGSHIKVKGVFEE